METERNVFPRRMAIALATALLILVVGGAWFLRFEVSSARSQAERHLTSVARLKADQIAAWRRNRLDDAALVAESPFLAEGVARFLADPTERVSRDLRARFRAVAAHSRYADVALTDLQGRTLLTLSGRRGIHEGGRRTLAEALQSGAPRLTELHTETWYPAPHLSAVAPIHAGGDPHRPAIAAVFLIADASTSLYPVVQMWPGPTATAETLLVRRDGDSALFLNDLRMWSNAALKLRAPARNSDMLAAQAVSGRRGLVEGHDYRGAQVVGVIIPIPNSDWIMIAKEDASEVYAGVRTRVILTSAVLALLLCGVGAVGAIAWLHDERVSYRSRYLAEARLRASVERHSVTLACIGDAVIATDVRGCVELMNPVAQGLTGWSDAEAVGKPIAEVFRIINEQTRETAQNPVERVLREGIVLGLANHTLLIARDGTELPIADSAAPIRDEDGKVSGVVLVFRDQTEERRAHRLLQARLALHEFARSHRGNALVDRTLDELSVLTGSPIALFHRVAAGEDGPAWRCSSRAPERWRLPDDAAPESLGVLGCELKRCLQERQPQILNVVHTTENELGISRMLVAPIVWYGQAVGAVALVNKPTDYTEHDAEAAAYLCDVTWHLLAEQRLQDELSWSEAFFRGAFHDHPAVKIVADLETGAIEDANQAAESFYGHPLPELKRMRLQDLWSAPEGALRDAIAHAASGEPCSYETRHRLADGSLRDVEVFVGRVAANGHSLLHCIVHDITDRKRAQEERERLLTAIEHAGEGIVVTDASGVIQYVNPAFERMTGYSKSEAVGQTPRILKSGEHDSAFYRKMWATIAGGGIYQGRIVNRRKDGELYTEECTISPVMDADGKIVNYVAIKRDITEQLRMEAQFRQAQKMEAVGRLAGGVAHDFNNMLSVITGYAEVAMGREDCPEAVHGDLEQILGASRRAAEMTRQLLAFARRQTVTPRVLDLNETIEGTLKMLRRLMGEDIDLQWLPGKGVWPVKVDPSQVDQVLANLCVNARDAIEGVGRVTIETGNVTFDEAYCATHVGFVQGDFVLLAVSDDGCGIDPEVRARLFEPFFTTKGAGRGTGLGLATVFGIVKQNDGFINVYSEPGHGATFRIYLPRYVGDAAPEERRPVALTPEGRGETVLIVEDEPAILELAQLMLERLGYRVLTANSPAEACSVADGYSGRIDLLITDVVMPGANGRELANRLAGRNPEMRFLFMSGYTANAIAHRGVLDEGVHFIQKPFSMRDLGARVREALESPPGVPPHVLGEPDTPA